MEKQGERVLIAGIGNSSFGDDAFGVEVIKKLAQNGLPGARVVDFGIRGIDLAFALLDDYDAAVLVDAAPRGEAPGTLYVMESEYPGVDDDTVVLPDGHSLHPHEVLHLARSLGEPVKRVVLVGCEPSPPGDATDADLSVPVRAAVDAAPALVERVVRDLLNRAPATPESAY